MRDHSFFANIHINRFGDLTLLMLSIRSVVHLEYWSVDGDVVKVHIFGEEDVTLKLERSITRIANILSSPLVYEEA